MSDMAVPDVLNAKFCECRTENCEITEGDDVNWCTGFWNELARENPPSLYPADSPIFSSKEYDWEDPAFLDNVFMCPDVEEVFSGALLGGHPAFIDNTYETKPNEADVYSMCPIGITNTSDAVNTKTQPSPPLNVSKQKKKRSRKPKVANGEETSVKRKCTTSTRKTKAKK